MKRQPQFILGTLASVAFFAMFLACSDKKKEAPAATATPYPAATFDPNLQQPISPVAPVTPIGPTTNCPPGTVPSGAGVYPTPMIGIGTPIPTPFAYPTPTPLFLVDPTPLFTPTTGYPTPYATPLPLGYTPDPFATPLIGGAVIPPGCVPTTPLTNGVTQSLVDQLLNPPQKAQCDAQNKLFINTRAALDSGSFCHQANKATYPCTREGIIAVFTQIGLGTQIASGSQGLDNMTSQGYQIDQCGDLNGKPVVLLRKLDQSNASNVSLQIYQMCPSDAGCLPLPK